jgi:hypothetical protein
MLSVFLLKYHNNQKIHNLIIFDISSLYNARACGLFVTRAGEPLLASDFLMWFSGVPSSTVSTSDFFNVVQWCT